MSDDMEIGLGPRLLAIETALRALIDQASSTDTGLRKRITAGSETYLATIPMLSDMEREFVVRARECVVSLIRPPTI